METENSKPLSPLIFVVLVPFIFIRPFVSGLAYPAFEIYYESLVISISLAIIFSGCRGGFKTLPYIYSIFPVLLLLLAYIISTITSVNIHNSVKDTLKFISYISVFFVASQADIGQKKILIKTILASAVIISIYSIYQYLWGYQHTIDYLKKTDSMLLSVSSYTRDILLSKRSIGTFPSPNILGSYLAMMFFLSLTFIQPRREQACLFPIQAIYAIIIIIALILTKSMGAWLSLALTFIILVILSYNQLKKYKWLIACSFICIGIIVSLILLNRWGRIADLNSPENSITQRVNYWKTAIGVIKDFPFSGVGPGNFQEVFLRYKTGLSTDTRYAHNIFLHQWAETGILGLIGMFYLIFSLLKNIRAWAGQKFILLAILALFFHNLIDNSYFIPETGLLWWILLGFYANPS